MVERIGWRAFLAALALLVLTGGFAVGFHYVERSDFDPGVRSLVQLEHVPVS